jgi:menaquinone-dependent protoporphyrinogen IX oxidase
MNTAVIYKSKYGATKKYAEWIAEELSCPLFEVSQINKSEIDTYDAVIYGGGLYAGSIAGIKDIVKNYKGRLVVFAVGLTPIEEMNPGDIAKNNGILTEKLFTFRGGYVFDKLSAPHRLIMRAVRKSMSSKSGITAEEKAALYENVVDFTDRAAIAPLIKHVKETN